MVVGSSLKVLRRGFPGCDADGLRYGQAGDMRNFPSSRFERIARPVLALALLPATCRGAPSIELAGAYFPAWLGCALVAVFGAILARAAMVVSGLAQVLPLQLFVCVSIGLLVAALVWLAWIGL